MSNRFYYERREQNPKKREILVLIDLHHLKKKRVQNPMIEFNFTYLRV
ncbi:hypothetical protein ES703_57474 [subsurface metagenome]